MRALRIKVTPKNTETANADSPNLGVNTRWRQFKVNANNACCNASKALRGLQTSLALVSVCGFGAMAACIAAESKLHNHSAHELDHKALIASSVINGAIGCIGAVGTVIATYVAMRRRSTTQITPQPSQIEASNAN